jgi:hypothetical protein
LLKWMPIDGMFEFHDQKIKFLGEPVLQRDANGQEQVGASVGLAICNRRFSGGVISAEVRFEHRSDRNACEFILWFDPANRWFLSAGIGGIGSQFFIRHWDGRWQTHAASGSKANLQAERTYKVQAFYRGSRAALSVDGVEVLAVTLPFTLPPAQAGVHFIDDMPIHVDNYSVHSERGKAFVVMQFSAPFTDIYEEVIKSTCDQFELNAHKADETFGPGLIIADVTREIAESDFVIADISSPNPNVYYEVGYAHAIRKPTILLANKELATLPFDVSGFRVLFYENSIAGKRKFEEGLQKHIAAILSKNGLGDGGRPNPVLQRIGSSLALGSDR